jgi:hypothetical protein
MSHISGLQTRGYGGHEIEGEFFCSSPYKDLDDKATIPNNIAFYAEGDAEEVHVLNLVLNVHVPRKAEEAHGTFMAYSDELALRVLGDGLPPAMKDAILDGRPEAYTVKGLFLELKREAWPSGRGYEMRFIITRPVSASAG